MSDHRSVSGEVAGECQCECHQPGFRITHFMPCCHPCRVCGLNIAYPVQHEGACRGVPAITRECATEDKGRDKRYEVEGRIIVR